MSVRTSGFAEAMLHGAPLRRMPEVTRSCLVVCGPAPVETPGLLDDLISRLDTSLDAYRKRRDQRDHRRQRMARKRRRGWA